MDYAETATHEGELVVVVESLNEAISEHHELLVVAGVELDSDRVYILIPEGFNYPGSMQVWSKTLTGRWAYVDTDGVLRVCDNPLLEV